MSDNHVLEYEKKRLVELKEWWKKLRPEKVMSQDVTVRVHVLDVLFNIIARLEAQMEQIKPGGWWFNKEELREHEEWKRKWNESEWSKK